MSRGAWIILIGAILIIAGIVLFAASVFGLISGLNLTTNTIAPGESFTRPISLEAGDVLTYVVAIENYTAGDQVTVSLRLPTGAEVNTTVVTSQSYTNAEVASSAGDHTLVIRNTGSQSVIVTHFAGQVNISSALLALAGMALGALGFILLIVGIIIWVLDRRKS